MGSHRSPDLRVAIDAFRRIVQALRTSNRDAEHRVGLSAAQLFALQQLEAHPGSSINELAAHTASVELDEGTLLVIQPFAGAAAGGAQ